MDILSDVLNVVRLNGGAFFTAEFTSPWAVYTPPAEDVARFLETRAESVAVFHVFVEGRCWITVGDVEPFPLAAGSAVIFSHSPSHQLASSPDLTAEPLVPLLASPDAGALPHIEHGGGGDVTRFFCGYLQCDHRFSPLMGALPALIIADPAGRNFDLGRVGDSKAGAPGHVVLPAGDERLQQMLSYLVDEAYANEPGTPAMLSRRIELLYLEVLRRYIAHATLTGKGWFAAVNDPEIGRALRALHLQPARKWTVDSLAAEVSMSRSTLAQRFTDLVGEPPVRYLTSWRMQMARTLIREGTLSLPQVSEQVGYDSEVAFNRAFKREVGVPPGTWRDSGSASRHVGSG